MLKWVRWNRGKQGLRRIVFWYALAVMLGAAVLGLILALIAREWTPQSMVAMTVGIGALLVALAFGLLEFTNPTFHPESELFDWTDVDALRELSQQPGVDRATRDLAQSLAERIAVVLPGRALPDSTQPAPPPRPPAMRRR